MTEAKPISTPMSSSMSHTLHYGSPLADAATYRTIVGSLQYLSLTRPDSPILLTSCRSSCINLQSTIGLPSNDYYAISVVP